jgi:hypothetical protein
MCLSVAGGISYAFFWRIMVWGWRRRLEALFFGWIGVEGMGRILKDNKNHSGQPLLVGNRLQFERRVPSYGNPFLT